MTTTLLPEPAAPAAGSVTPPPATHPYRLAGITAGELLVLGLALLLPLALVVQAFMPFLAPKTAVLLVATGPGLVVLALACRARDRAAWWAAGLVVVAVVSTVLADVPMLSVFGTYGWGNGLLLVAGTVGAWALGRTLGPRAREVLLGVLLAAALVNAAFAWLQSLLDFGPSAFDLYAGRALGFMGNPVQLGALCAGALWLAAVRVRTTARLALTLLGVVVLAGALQLSGSRIALVAGAAAVVLAARRADRRRLTAVIAAFLLGAVLTMVMPTDARSSASRASGESAGGLAPRVAVWGNGVAGLAERPLLGFGPGRFATASTPRASLEVARYTGSDVQYADAHNVFVEYAVTTGVLGLVALLGWLVAAGRRARGPLVGFVIAVAASMLLQPQYVGLTPVVALALGASGPRLTALARPGRARVVAVAAGTVTAVVGFVLGGALVAGDVAYSEGVRTRSEAAFDRVDRLVPPWPEISARRAALASRQRVFTGDRSYEAVARREALDAVRRDPADPQWRYLLGSIEEAGGDLVAADRRYAEALTRNPWSVQALSGRYRIAVKEDRFGAAQPIRDRLCRVGPDACPPPPARYARELEAAGAR